MARIYDEIPNAKLAQFSKLKFVQGSNFVKFRDFFRAKYLSGFIVRANTFDNVVGTFPIGFTIWDMATKETINELNCDIIENSGSKNGEKVFYGELPQSINKWIKLYDNGSSEHIAYMGNPAPDFQHNSQLYLSLRKGIEHFNFWAFTKHNLFFGCVYFAVRQVIEATWLNDRDQFLYPNNGWETDKEFQNDCLAFTLFHGQNRISNSEGTNHWLPFTEQEVNAQEKFESHFMTDFIKGKIKPDDTAKDIFSILEEPKQHYAKPLSFSSEATAVFDVGRALWKYYHSQKGVNVNASLYDIREHFQGRNEQGRMNTRSTDEQYTQLIGELRSKLSLLAEKISPKVYEYGFLKA